MNIFRAILTDNGETFLVDAHHENKKVSHLFVHPIKDGIVQPMCQLADVTILVDTIEKALTEI
jgi:hypothetical protein